MKLRFFNPSHEEALASGSPLYCPTAAARDFAADLSALPALWAAPADVVLLEAAAPPPPAWALARGVSFAAVERVPAALARAASGADVWGWDALVVRRLLRAGLPPALLPSSGALEVLRRLSSRQRVTELLPRLRAALPASVGESRWCASEAEAAACLAEWGRVVAKAPWSGSGRGVFRYEGPATASHRRLCALLRTQGGVELEPWYERRLDLAAEFRSDGCGRVAYEGLSLFATNERGAYAGNFVAPEEVLRSLVDAELGPGVWGRAVAVLEGELSRWLGRAYAGPLGVDMMSVATPAGPRLHPCVELNLRHTMGGVALALRSFVPSGRVCRFAVVPPGTSAAAGPGALCLTPGARRFEAALLPARLPQAGA